MRTSNIILLSLFLLVFGTAAALAITLRYKIDHHLYDKLNDKEPDSMEGVSINMPLSPFSEIVLDAYPGTIIRKGDANSIRWIRFKGVSAPPYILSGDSLVLRPQTGDPYAANVTITVQDLRSIRLRSVSNCKIVGFKQDSLTIYGESLGDDDSVQSMDLKRLQLTLDGNKTLVLSNSAVGGLWLDLKNDAGLSLENARMGWIKGRWKGDISLTADSATLQNGIGKIEAIH